jgi:hypothetical protein
MVYVYVKVIDDRFNKLRKTAGIKTTGRSPQQED